MANPVKLHLSQTAVLARFRDGGIMEECLAVLDQHEIPYRIETTAPVFEITSIGSAGGNHQAIVLVEATKLNAARQIMMDDARATVKLSPPTADDYLNTLGTPQLQEMLGAAAEWSFYDLATAEFLLAQRQAIVPPIVFPEPDAPPAEYPPVRAKLSLILFGVFVTGGVYGIIIAWSLIFSRQHGKDSPYHYDEFSRRLGLVILCLTLLAWGVSVSLIWGTIITPNGARGGSFHHYHVD